MNVKVKFDPGYSKFSVAFPEEISQVLDYIARLKQMHQKKFEFQKLEGMSVKIIKDCASVYLGCILWGAYLSCKYRDVPREIEGNVIKETGVDPNYGAEIDFILETIAKLDKASVFYLRRPLKIDKKVIGYFNDYKDFAELNDNFKETAVTSDIKIPENYNYFEGYTEEKLEELRQNIETVIESDNIQGILELV